MKIRNIFLSSESSSSLPILDFCERNGILLIRKSLISFKRIPFQVPTDWSVVFFTSPRSFDFFTSEGFDLRSDQYIACIGPETKKHIEASGYQVSFFGEHAGNPQQIAGEFKEWLGDRVALFPQSAKSNKSIEAELPEFQKIPLLVYDTIENTVGFSTLFSIYVFTSPSNYKSFKTVNTIPADAKVIAWGNATAETMMNDNVPVHFILNTSTYSELLEILQKIIK